MNNGFDNFIVDNSRHLKQGVQNVTFVFARSSMYKIHHNNEKHEMINYEDHEAT